MSRAWTGPATGATVAFGLQEWLIGTPAELDAALAALAGAGAGVHVAPRQSLGGARLRPFPHLHPDSLCHRCPALGAGRGQEDTMSTTILTGLQPRTGRTRRARADYTAAAQRVAAGWERLAEQAAPGQRAATLLQLSADEQLCADLHVVACGRSQRPTGQESSAALMLLWLATTEVLSAQPGTRVAAAPMAEAIAAANYPTPWPAALPFLEQLCGAVNPAVRARLVELLYADLVGVHGYDVAAALDAAHGAYRQLAARAGGQS